MGKTESIEALLTPSLRVSRPVAACARCRSAKIKCDGKLPACSACERSGKASSCTSANDEFARGKERSYVAALEAAAQRLQKKIDEARATPAGPQQMLVQSKGRNPAQIQNRKVSGPQRKEALDVDELVSDFGFLTVNATSRDFHGFTSTMSFAKLLICAAKKKDLAESGNSQLPPRHVAMQGVEQYFENIFVLLPFFSETELMSSISRIYQDSSKSMPVAPIDLWYLRLVLAISAASTSQTRGDEHDKTALRHILAAMSLADYVLHPGSIVGVQALLLLVQYALVDPEHFDCWYLVSMAARLVVDLGLHCEPSAETKITKEALDIRRRIFYTTYALDRLISMSLGRPFSFTDDSAAEVPLPAAGTEPDKQSPSQLFLRSFKPSLYLFDIRRVQSAFYQTTRWSSRSPWSLATAAAYASSVSNDVHAWYATIPNTLPQRHLVLFNLERLYCQILVVAPNQKVPIVNMTELNKALVFEYAAQFAEQLRPVIGDVSWHAYLTIADIWRARYVGRQFLEVMWSDFDRLLKSQHVLVGGDTASDTRPMENCIRAMNCVRKITEVLDYARQRWNMPEMHNKFEQESAVLLTRLKNRQQEFSATQHSSVQPTFSSLPNVQQYGSEYFNEGQQSYHDSINAFQNLNTSSNDVGSVDGHAVQRPRFLTPPGSSSDGLSGFNLPPGSLPRRSYEFTGGRG